MTPIPDSLKSSLRHAYGQAASRRSQWESHWQDCYHYALPGRASAVNGFATQGGKRHDDLYDGTAGDAVEQLAASLMAELTPPFERWFALKPGPDLPADEAAALAPALDKASRALQAQLEQSNLLVELHQCFLDLVTAGTASLLCEMAGPDAPSAFRFLAVPLGQALFEEGTSGLLDQTWRVTQASQPLLISRFPEKADKINDIFTSRKPGGGNQAQNPLLLIEYITSLNDLGPEILKALGIELGLETLSAGHVRLAFLSEGMAGQNPFDGEITLLDSGLFSHAPFINFRWMKTPGEAYGRSPVMKMLPEIKTANKVVELILKNASIAVTGIWQAEDDGVLNPATIELVPGAIIPKAQGSQGLTPLRPAGDFDVSQLVLEDTRKRIRHGLMVDRLGVVQGPQMSATEVMERASEMTRLMVAVFGRLQAELMTPLGARLIDILQQRGAIPDWPIDGRLLELQIVSPLTRLRKQQHLQAAQQWLGTMREFGPQALMGLDIAHIGKWLADSLNLPPELTGELTNPPPTTPIIDPVIDPAIE